MTFEKVQAIIANQLGIDEAEVQLTTDFENITIDTDQNLKTVQDLVNYIDSL